MPADRHVRARFSAETIVVYQAYASPIADAALAAGTFVTPFKRERTTWIKPSFLWMKERVYPLPESLRDRIGASCR
jgi:hypothetical protein